MDPEDPVDVTREGDDSGNDTDDLSVIYHRAGLAEVYEQGRADGAADERHDWADYLESIRAHKLPEGAKPWNVSDVIVALRADVRPFGSSRGDFD